jgi:hypothetical protein
VSISSIAKKVSRSIMGRVAAGADLGDEDEEEVDNPGAGEDEGKHDDGDEDAVDLTVEGVAGAAAAAAAAVCKRARSSRMSEVRVGKDSDHSDSSDDGGGGKDDELKEWSGGEGEEEEEEKEETEEEEEEEEEEEVNDVEGQFEVERIIDHKCVGVSLQYRIKWKGYGGMHNSWETEAAVHECEAVLARYMKTKRGKALASSKRKRKATD